MEGREQCVQTPNQEEENEHVRGGACTQGTWEREECGVQTGRTSGSNPGCSYWRLEMRRMKTHQLDPRFSQARTSIKPTGVTCHLDIPTVITQWARDQAAA